MDSESVRPLTLRNAVDYEDDFDDFGQPTKQ